MNLGMLWYEDDPKTTLAIKVEQAATYYQKKYGVIPDMCYVNPKVQLEKETLVGKIIVRTLRSILPNHLWIGIQEKGEQHG